MTNYRLRPSVSRGVKVTRCESHLLSIGGGTCMLKEGRVGGGLKVEGEGEGMWI